PDPRHRRRHQARPLRPAHPPGRRGSRRRHAVHRAGRARRADGSRAGVPRARALSRDRARIALSAGPRVGLLRRSRGCFVSSGVATADSRTPVSGAGASHAVTVVLRLLNRYSFAFALLLTVALLTTTIIRDPDPWSSAF